MPDLGDNVAADGVDAVRLQLDAGAIREIVEACLAANEKAIAIEFLDVEIGVAERRGVANDVLDNVGERNDAFDAAEFIDDDGHALGTRQETAEQIERAHGFGDERRRQQHLRVVRARIHQENFRVENAEDVVRVIGVDGHALVPSGLQQRDRFVICKVVRQRKSVDARRHAILRGFVAQFEDFLDHLALGLVQRALFLTDLDQRLEFFVAQVRARAQLLRRKKSTMAMLTRSSPRPSVSSNG